METIIVYGQINYTLCSEKFKHTFTNTRRFSGTKRSSDHRLVICKLEVGKQNIFINANKTHSKSYNTFKLLKSEEAKNAYNLTTWHQK